MAQAFEAAWEGKIAAGLVVARYGYGGRADGWKSLRQDIRYRIKRVLQQPGECLTLCRACIRTTW